MGKALNPRKPGKSTGGRPPKEGDRYPGGKLKKQGPNQLMVDRRKALCADVTMASCPLDAAFSNGWLSAQEYAAGQAYVAIHARARLGSPGVKTATDHSKPDPVGDVRRVSWSEMSFDEINRIWDSAMRDVGTEGAAARLEESAAKAMNQWKSVIGSMTLFQRTEVHAFCIEESWPQWIIQRAAGRMDTSWEAKRTLLVAGLKAIHLAIRKPVDQPSDHFEPAKASAANKGVISRQVYVDECGAVVLEVERIEGRKAA